MSIVSIKYFNYLYDRFYYWRSITYRNYSIVKYPSLFLSTWRKALPSAWIYFYGNCDAMYATTTVLNLVIADKYPWKLCELSHFWKVQLQRNLIWLSCHPRMLQDLVNRYSLLYRHQDPSDQIFQFCADLFHLWNLLTKHLLSRLYESFWTLFSISLSSAPSKGGQADTKI